MMNYSVDLNKLSNQITAAKVGSYSRLSTLASGTYRSKQIFLTNGRKVSTVGTSLGRENYDLLSRSQTFWKKKGGAGEGPPPPHTHNPTRPPHPPNHPPPLFNLLTNRPS